MMYAQPVLLFSVATSRAAWSCEATRAIAQEVAAFPCGEGHSNATLIIDLGLADAQVDPVRLDDLERQAAVIGGRVAERGCGALAIVGDISRLSPEAVVWLASDGSWPSWTDSETTRRILEALQNKIVDRGQRSAEALSAGETAIHLRGLLDDLGYAYFMSVLDDGRPIVSSRTEQLLLGDPPEAILSSRPGVHWWAHPDERASWVHRLRRDRIATGVNVLVSTHSGGRRWLTIDGRIGELAGGREVVEGIFHDATKRRFMERLANALTAVGSAEEGLRGTAEIVCKAAAQLFEVGACAWLWRSVEHGRVFLGHVWLSSGSWSGLDAAFAEEVSRRAPLVLEMPSWAWKLWLGPGEVPQQAPPEIFGSVLSMLFSDAATTIDSALVLPLPGTRNEDDPPPSHSEPFDSALLIPISGKLTFDIRDHWQSIAEFLSLCRRQFLLAADRDAIALVHRVLAPSRNGLRRDAASAGVGGFADLGELLTKARRELQQVVSMEACTILRTGIEDRRWTLIPCSSSDSKLMRNECKYELGESFIGVVAESGKPRVSFDIRQEDGVQSRYPEHTLHPRQTWVAIPLLDRNGRTIGLIRCVNRTIGVPSHAAVTGFSALDMKVLIEFGRACALLVELAQMQEARKRMLSVISHELKTPATIIRNCVLDLEETHGTGDPTIVELQLYSTVLVSLLEQVDVVRGRSRVTTSEPRVTDIKEIVENMKRRLSPMLGKHRGASRPITVDISKRPRFLLPQEEFARIIFNLLVNAIKYSLPDQLEIVVRGESDTNGYHLHFQDRGIGVEEKFKDRLFERQFRTPRAIKHDPGGLGLGLAISRQIAQEFGGDITLKSCHNPTDFVLSIPMQLSVR